MFLECLGHLWPYISLRVSYSSWLAWNHPLRRCSCWFPAGCGISSASWPPTRRRMRCATSTSTMTRTKRSEGSKIRQPCAATERNAQFWLRESVRGLNLEGYFSTSNRDSMRFTAWWCLMIPIAVTMLLGRRIQPPSRQYQTYQTINSVSSYAQNIGEPDACRF